MSAVFLPAARRLFTACCGSQTALLPHFSMEKQKQNIVSVFFLTFILRLPRDFTVICHRKTLKITRGGGTGIIWLFVGGRKSNKSSWRRTSRRIIRRPSISQKCPKSAYNKFSLKQFRFSSKILRICEESGEVACHGHLT